MGFSLLVCLWWGDWVLHIKEKRDKFGTNILFYYICGTKIIVSYMTREILYKKPSNEQKQNLPDFKIVLERKNTILIDWIKVHKLINISGLCKEAGINRSNFDKSLKMGIISPKHEITLINILKDYGYGK